MIDRLVQNAAGIDVLVASFPTGTRVMTDIETALSRAIDRSVHDLDDVACRCTSCSRISSATSTTTRWTRWRCAGCREVAAARLRRARDLLTLQRRSCAARPSGPPTSSPRSSPPCSPAARRAVRAVRLAAPLPSLRGDRIRLQEALSLVGQRLPCGHAGPVHAQHHRGRHRRGLARDVCRRADRPRRDRCHIGRASRLGARRIIAGRRIRHRDAVAAVMPRLLGRRTRLRTDFRRSRGATGAARPRAHTAASRCRLRHRCREPGSGSFGAAAAKISQSKPLPARRQIGKYSVPPSMDHFGAVARPVVTATRLVFAPSESIT